MKGDHLTIEPPNQVAALRDIRGLLDRQRYGDALSALKLYGERERAYAIAVMERQRYEVSDAC